MSAGCRPLAFCLAIGEPADCTCWAWPFVCRPNQLLPHLPDEPSHPRGGWAYSQICRIYPDGGGVYTAAKSKSRTLAVVGALLLFADYTVTASLSVLDAFHYFGLPIQKHAQVAESNVAANTGDQTKVQDAGDGIIVESDSAQTVDLPSLPPGITIPTDVKDVTYDSQKKQLRVDGNMSAISRGDLLALTTDPTWQHAIRKLYDESQPEQLLAWDSPGLWAMIAIAVSACST